MELCWLTTSKCNQRCSYCDRFIERETLNLDAYLSILDKLISYGVKRLTFGGGESLILDEFSHIVKRAYAHGIHLKLVTNGKLLPEKSNLIQYFDEITLSIDSADRNINELLGRGADHLNTVNFAVDLIKNSGANTKININTVVTKINLQQAVELAPYIKQWNVQQWRIFRFCPLRETAVRNRDMFEINSWQFQNIRTSIENIKLNCRVQFRDYEDMESGYLLIAPSGKLCVSRDQKDLVIGSMLTDDLARWFT